MRPWTDHNRFNQGGYSAPTLMPQEQNYKNKRLFMEDIDKAEHRAAVRAEWLEDLRQEALEEEYEMKRIDNGED